MASIVARYATSARTAARPRLRLRSAAAVPWLISLLFLLCSAVTTHAGDEPAGFRVSFTKLGPEAVEDDAAGFIAALGARQGYAASPCGAQAVSWHSPPAGVPPERWVSLVAVGFRTRRDWLAFVFDGPDGAMSFAVRRPATSVPTPGLRPDEMMPGPKQVSSNAVRELAADFGHGFPARHKAGERPRLRIVVEQWKGAGAGAPHGDEGPDAALEPGEGPKDITAQDLAGFEALAGAAAWMAGWQPVFGDAPRVLKLQVASGVQAYSIQATLSGEGGAARYRKLDVPADDLSAYLLRACVKLRAGDAVSDFARIAAEDARVLSASADSVVVSAEGALVAWDPATGAERWRIPPPPRISYRYMSRRTSAGEVLVCQISGDLRRVGAEGQVTALAGAEPSFSWGFDLAPDGDVAVAQGAELVLFRQGKEAWRHRGIVPFTAGPAFSEDRVLTGSSTGELVCLSKKDGAVIWRKPVGGKLVGPVTVVENLVLAAGTEGLLVAARLADGSTAWKADIGDVLLAPPQKLGNRLVVASKANTVLLLDPATGAEKARWQAKTWLADIAVCPPADGGCAVCADQTGNVVFLDGDGLRPVRTVALGVDLVSGVTVVEKMPTLWGSEGGPIYEEAPAALVPDRQGFLYIVPVPHRQARKEAK